MAGPAVSLLLGGFGMGAAGVLAATTDAQLVTQSIVWFASSNLILGVFNMLPGAPLDGGRVFTALRWRHHGDVHRARREGARAGMAVASGLIAIGIVAVFSGYVDTGLWLAFLGWFLASAARQELADDQARHILASVTLASVMTPNPVTVPPGLSLGTLVTDVLPRVRGSSIPVVVDGRLIGLITPDHLRTVPPARWSDTEVGAVASPLDKISTAGPFEYLSSVLDRQEGVLRRIVVTDTEGRVVGIVTPTDLARIIQRAALRDLAEHPETTLNRRG
jgi:CBS domain-containing protein